MYSISKEYLVCKSNVVEANVPPLYGRGKVGSTNPRTKLAHSVNFPLRLFGSRHDTFRIIYHHYSSYNFNHGRLRSNAYWVLRENNIFCKFQVVFFFIQVENECFFDMPYGILDTLSNGLNKVPQQAIQNHHHQGTLLPRLLLFLGCLVVCFHHF